MKLQNWFLTQDLAHLNHKLVMRDLAWTFFRNRKGTCFAQLQDRKGGSYGSTLSVPPSSSVIHITRQARKAKPLPILPDEQNAYHDVILKLLAFKASAVHLEKDKELLRRC